MNNIIFSPSLLSADFSKIAEELEDIQKTGTTWIHLDVMDGIFVPNITFGPPIIKAMRAHSDLFFDTHLMIQEPIRYIKEFAAAGANMITFHLEATKNVAETIEAIKLENCKVGLALNPATSLDGIEAYLDHIDMILLMSVNPGFGGQSFIDITDKIKKLSDLRNVSKRAFLIQVDGGINTMTVSKVVQSGADVIVAGSAIFGKTDRKKAIEDLKNAINWEC